MDQPEAGRKGLDPKHEGDYAMSERIYSVEDDDQEVPDLEEGILPGVDLDLGSETEISGGNDLSQMDEENMYGNDVALDYPDDDDADA